VSAAKAASTAYVPRLKQLFRDTVAAALRQEFNYDSSMQIPRLTKIVVSVGAGEAVDNRKVLEDAGNELGVITGRKAVRTKARRSIAAFKIREGMEIGAMVTLRGDYMFEFLDRLVSVAIPRIKDFRGLNPNAFDGRGNYSLGIDDQTIFPEIDYDKIERVSGMNIAMVTSAATDREGRALLTALGVPFERQGAN
jgi:large subunit ribosomal protein L5